MRALLATAVAVVTGACWLLAAGTVAGQEEKSVPRQGFPRAQIVPQPNEQLSFELDGREVLRYHYGAGASRPYFFPVIGPCGRPITRIGHPRDPDSHRHHLSVWIGHQNVAGRNFWELSPGAGKIVPERIVKTDDGDRAALTIRATWQDEQKTALLADERVWTFTPRDDAPGEFFLDLDLTLTPPGGNITLGKTHFGLLAVRVAKTMGVNDGGGHITNSEGKVDEKDVLWQRARWCDYSGPAAPGPVINGITLFDHPGNPGHPTHFHVRNDGWMGASLTEGGPLELSKEQPLRLRYRLWVHAGPCDPKLTETQWARWSGEKEKQP